MTASENYFSWQLALQSTLQVATGLVWIWEEEPRGHMMHPYGILSGLDSVEMVGRDWWQITATGPGEAIPAMVGSRTGQVSARVVSRSQLAREKAGTYIETARLYLSSPYVSDAWNTVGMSVADIGPIRRLDAVKVNDRMESIASMTITLNLTPDAILGGPDMGRMEKIKISSAVLGEAGTLLPTPPNFTDEELP